MFRNNQRKKYRVNFRGRERRNIGAPFYENVCIDIRRCIRSGSTPSLSFIYIYIHTYMYIIYIIDKYICIYILCRTDTHTHINIYISHVYI